MTPAEEFARVLAEAGEPEPAERPLCVRIAAEMKAGLSEVFADRMLRWQQHEAARLQAERETGPDCDRLSIPPPVPPGIW